MESAISEVPDSWRAAALRHVGSNLDMVEVERPELAHGQVLVRLIYSGVCRSQLMEVRGLRGEDRWVPHLLGHEGVGVVVHTGLGVTKVQSGDRVILGWIAGDGINASPPVFRSTRGETINAGRVTTFSEYSVVSENRLYLAPDEVDDRTAVLFGCALLTGAGMALNEASLEPGQSVLVNGAGGVGIAALLGALARGADVIVAEPDAAKQKLSIQLGARYAFDPLNSDDVRVFRSMWPEGVDVALDSSGHVAAMEFAFSALKYGGGLLVFASHPPAGEFLRLDPHELIRGRRIRGSWGGASKPDADIPAMSRMLRARGVDLNFMTPRTYSLDHVDEALRDLDSGNGLRPLLAIAAGK